MVGLRKNQNLRIDLSPDPSPVEVLKIVSIVAKFINVDNAQPVRKIVKYVAKRTILPKSVSLVKAKAKVKALVVLSTNHLSIEK